MKADQIRGLGMDMTEPHKTAAKGDAIQMPVDSMASKTLTIHAELKKCHSCGHQHDVHTHTRRDVHQQDAWCCDPPLPHSQRWGLLIG